MKLINRNTEQIVVFGEGIVNLQEIGCKNVAEMMEASWEDYQESETFWYISPTGTPIKSEVSIYDPLEIHLMKRIGNYFESEEDAEKAVEKQKAWKRLEDKGFRFTGFHLHDRIIDFDVKTYYNFPPEEEQLEKDLHLLFGGTE